MNGKRFFERLAVKNVPCNLYLPESDSEISGEVHDISENGIAIKVSNEDAKKIQKNSDENLKFVFLDDYKYLDSDVNDVVMGKVSVKHTSSVDGEYALIGGKVTDDIPEYEKYVLRRKTSHFLNSSNIMS
ncbi:MAG: PilZ domain-containing protein [Lachnospiraceae bacterium]|nr:PilZ domain-containing protein [Lachnospiraceae bacterium]